MPELDTLTLSRAQFALTVSFHILFPTLTIGLASFLAVLEGLWLYTKEEVYLRLYRFWSKFFALSFGMGVVSGVVMSFEFGTNFAEFSRVAGNVLGPLLSFEVLTAFFLEAGFLGIMLFGWGRVSRSMHFAATLCVAFGMFISMFWIISANSWMHTPAGAEWRDGVFYPLDWWAIVFNPSMPYRLAHMMLATYLTSAFVIAGVSAWYLLHGRERLFATRAITLALGMASISAPLQILVGDMHGLNVEEHQPLKVAAMEGRWDTMAGAPLLLFAIPDQAAEKNHFEIGIPYGASLILKHSFDGVVEGLKEVPPEDRPPMAPVFFAFRIMVGCGALLVALAWASTFFAWRGTLTEQRWLLRVLAYATPLGFLATLSGWYVAEMGRQPWVVTGMMRTADAVSQIEPGRVLYSLIALAVVYGIIFTAYLHFLTSLVRKGPEASEHEGTTATPHVWQPALLKDT
jgi:cytochrome bd ubiquinol oxidase subunit I